MSEPSRLQRGATRVRLDLPVWADFVSEGLDEFFAVSMNSAMTLVRASTAFRHTRRANRRRQRDGYRESVALGATRRSGAATTSLRQVKGTVMHPHDRRPGRGAGVVHRGTMRAAACPSASSDVRASSLPPTRPTTTTFTTPSPITLHHQPPAPPSTPPSTPAAPAPPGFTQRAFRNHVVALGEPEATPARRLSAK